MTSARELVERYLARNPDKRRSGPPRRVDPAAAARLKRMIEGENTVKSTDTISGKDLWAAYRDWFVGEKLGPGLCAQRLGVKESALLTAWKDRGYEPDRRSSSAIRARRQLAGQEAQQPQGPAPASNGAAPDQAAAKQARPAVVVAEPAGMADVAQPEAQLQAVMRQLQQMLAMENVAVSGRVQLDLRVEVDLGEAA